MRAGYPVHRKNLVRDAAEKVLRDRPGISRDELAEQVRSVLVEQSGKTSYTGSTYVALRLACWLREAADQGALARVIEGGDVRYYLTEGGQA